MSNILPSVAVIACSLLAYLDKEFAVSFGVKTNGDLLAAIVVSFVPAFNSYVVLKTMATVIERPYFKQPLHKD